MKRKSFLFLAVLGVMVALAVMGAQKKKPTLLVLEWAAKASGDKPPVAILIEMGLKDTNPTSWSSRATVTGAKVKHREGYRFRTGDKLIEPNGWEASSHRGLRVPQGQPQVARMEGNATVGVVLHLADVEDDAKLTVEPRPGGLEKHEVVALKDVLAGHPRTLWTEPPWFASSPLPRRWSPTRPKTTSPPPPTARTARSGSRTSVTQ